MNQVCLTGRLSHDPEKKMTTTKKTLSVCRMAVTRDTKKSAYGDTDFIPITAWGTLGDFVSCYGAKGRLMELTGRLRVQTYAGADEKVHHQMYVIADKVRFLDSNKKAQLQELESDELEEIDPAEFFG